MMRNIVLIWKESRVIPWLFSLSWEQREFGETFDFLTNNTLSRAELNDETGSVLNVHYGDILVKFGEIIDTETDHLPHISDVTKVVRPAFLMDGDVIIADTAEDNTVGKCAEIIGIADKLVVSGLHTIPCRPRRQFAQGYLGYFMNSPAFHDQLLPLMQGTKVASVSKSAMADTLICYPADVTEQAFIGQYFMKLDNLITLHHRQEKRSGHNPFQMQRRITFTWEQRKLSEIVEVCSGRDYKHLSEGDIPVYGTGGYMLSVNDALSYDRDAIGIGRKGTIDKPYVLKAPFWTVDTLFYAVPEHSECLDFVHDIFQIIDWKKKDESTGVPSLSKEAINNTEVMVPQIDEQIAIGVFFARIDTLITLHQREYFKRQTEVNYVKYNQRDGPVLRILCAMDWCL